MVKHCSCGASANYNYPGKSSLLCVRCKKPGMIHVYKRYCTGPYCNKWASYNYPGQSSGIVCGEHKEDGMISVTSAICEEAGCQRTANFSWPKDRKNRRFCLEHKPEGMISRFEKEKRNKNFKKLFDQPLVTQAVLNQ